MNDSYESAVAALKDAIAKGYTNDQYRQIRGAKGEVLARFRPIFNPAHVGQIREDEFRSLLDFKNNQHWSGLHRQGPRICADMPVLRDALQVLLDVERPVGERIDYAVSRVSGMGKAIVCAILHVSYSDLYGVWNNVSEGKLKRLDLWPSFDRGASLGTKYEAINDVLQRLATELEVDLWTLDAVLWLPLVGEGDADAGGPEAAPDVDLDEGEPDEVISAQRFGLEAELQRFLWRNWDHTELGHEWEPYTEPGDDRRGFEYPCGVGRIDILAKHRTEPRWLVVELKRGQTSDQTVGQVLRYMGWIHHELAHDGETVEGLVIAHEADSKLRYALEMVPSVRMKTYQVEFRLNEPPGLGASG